MRLRVAAAAIVLVGTIVGCGGSDQGAESTEAPEVTDAAEAAASSTVEVDTTTAPSSTPATTDAAASTSMAVETTEPTASTTEPTASTTTPSAVTDLGRVVSLGEEVLLADVLELGIVPVATTVTVGSAGIQGIDSPVVDGMTTFEMTSLNLEELAAIRPDTIITYQFWVNQVGADVLGGMGELIIVPDGLRGIENLRALGDLVGITEPVDRIAAQLDAAKAEARAALGDSCEISLATVYAGPSVAAFVTGPWTLPQAILDVGCTLVPGEDTKHDQNGRAWLSEEQYGLLSGPRMVLLQSETVEGESESLAEISAHPVWSQLPAVASGEIFTFDRLGYPGAEGELRFIDDFVAEMAP